jgi:hypothetical protein
MINLYLFLLLATSDIKPPVTHYINSDSLYIAGQKNLLRNLYKRQLELTKDTNYYNLQIQKSK